MFLITDDSRLLGAQMLVKLPKKRGRPTRYNFVVLPAGHCAFLPAGTYSSAQSVREAAKQHARRHEPGARYSVSDRPEGVLITRLPDIR